VDDVNLKVLACNMRRALRAPEECDIPYLLETAARELDRLRMLREDTLEVERVMVENESLQDKVNRQVKLVAEYGGPRCTALCPATLGPGSYSLAHRCLLPGGHEGEHIWRCEVERFRTTTPQEFSPAPINVDTTSSLTIDAKKQLEQECRVTEEMLERRASIWFSP
jgi:hypothetical protein